MPEPATFASAATFPSFAQHLICLSALQLQHLLSDTLDFASSVGRASFIVASMILETAPKNEELFHQVVPDPT